MGFSDQIDRYRKRVSIILAGRRLRGRTPEPPPAPFVCGVTRSGTTLLRLMLDSHPDVAIPGETHWVPKLIKAFSLTDTQAEAILNMRLRSLRKLEEMEIRKEHESLTAEQKDLKKLLGSPKLGPLLWQFAPTKKFDEADFGGFLELLPDTFD